MRLLNNVLERPVRKQLEKAGIQIGGKDPGDITVHNSAFYSKLALDGIMGLGNAYAQGIWDCNALDQFFDRALRGNLLGLTKWAPSAIIDRTKHVIFNMQSRDAAKHNSGDHYDLSNKLYECMLDPYMQYTCAYWADGIADLDIAQLCKLQMICDKLDLKPGMKVLDMGCGWGGLARYIAEHYDVTVTGINLSQEQISYATRRSDNSNLTFLYRDYRDAESLGKFDRIVSIGMGEHVGAKNYAEWMRVIKHCLRHNGLALLHMFGRNSTSVPLLDPWTRRYIFPGLELPTLQQLVAATEGSHFNVADVHEIGRHYDPTLMAWERNFSNKIEEIRPSVSGKNFNERGWRYYLHSAAGSFRSEQIRLWQIVISQELSKPYIAVRPEGRRHKETATV